MRVVRYLKLSFKDCTTAVFEVISGLKTPPSPERLPPNFKIPQYIHTRRRKCLTKIETKSNRSSFCNTSCTGPVWDIHEFKTSDYCNSLSMVVQGFVPTTAGLPSTRSCTLSASTFIGKAVNPVRPLQTKQTSTGRAVVHMKKNRFHQPIQPQRQNQMSMPEDGTPVFAIFVRTSRTKIWYPLGAVQGDDRSKSLVNALKGGFLKSMYANTLDKGIAQTVYGKDSGRYVQNALRMYPQLKKYKKDLEFGYKVAAVGLETQPTKLVTREMALTFVAWAKNKFDTVFKGAK